MFSLQGKKDYKVVFIKGGISKIGTPYTFISVESEITGSAKYADRLKINVWGADLSHQFKVEDYVKILGASEVGIVKSKAQNSEKWYENLTITCNGEDIVFGQTPVEKPKESPPIEFQEIDSSELPF